jgi:hypothetical protein
MRSSSAASVKALSNINSIRAHKFETFIGLASKRACFLFELNVCGLPTLFQTLQLHLYSCKATTCRRALSLHNIVYYESAMHNRSLWKQHTAHAAMNVATLNLRKCTVVYLTVEFVKTCAGNMQNCWVHASCVSVERYIRLCCCCYCCYSCCCCAMALKTSRKHASLYTQATLRSIQIRTVFSTSLC